jgi:hypothetical protein
MEVYRRFGVVAAYTSGTHGPVDTDYTGNISEDIFTLAAVRI